MIVGTCTSRRGYAVLHGCSGWVAGQWLCSDCQTRFATRCARDNPKCVGIGKELTCAQSPAWKCACPVVLPSGRILVVYLWNKSIRTERERTTREVYVVHSDDDGLSWSVPRNITRSVYRRDWGWYGTGPCHAIVKLREPHKGRIVVPARMLPTG